MPITILFNHTPPSSLAVSVSVSFSISSHVRLVYPPVRNTAAHRRRPRYLTRRP